jgi:hypothetical protein
MEIKVGDLLWHPYGKGSYGTVLKVKGEKCAIYWWNPEDGTENNDYLKAGYHVRYVRGWKRFVEEKCSVSSTG